VVWRVPISLKSRPHKDYSNLLIHFILFCYLQVLLELHQLKCIITHKYHIENLRKKLQGKYQDRGWEQCGHGNKSGHMKSVQCNTSQILAWMKATQKEMFQAHKRKKYKSTQDPFSKLYQLRQYLSSVDTLVCNPGVNSATVTVLLSCESCKLSARLAYPLHDTTRKAWVMSRQKILGAPNWGHFFLPLTHSHVKHWNGKQRHSASPSMRTALNCWYNRVWHGVLFSDVISKDLISWITQHVGFQPELLVWVPGHKWNYEEVNAGQLGHKQHSASQSFQEDYHWLDETPQKQNP
jgi:hypothetical protein